VEEEIFIKLSHYTPQRRLGGEVKLLLIIDLGTRGGGEYSASHPGCVLALGKEAPGNHWTGGWVGHRAVLDREARGKILSFLKLFYRR
jgi:hypothetical protein